MDKDEVEKYVKAGKIAAEAITFAKPLALPGARLLDIAERVEEFIRKKGGEPAFPLNLSLNDVAAHYTPTFVDPLTLREGDMLKIDLGAHVDGYIADTAVTVQIGKPDKMKQDMIKTIERALEAALKIAKPGANVGEIGATIEDTITSAGFKPVRNLSGHLIQRHVIHGGFTIPNIRFKTNATLEEGNAYAIEPFLTDGAGAIRESEKAHIYMWQAPVAVRLPAARQLLGEIYERFKTLPFAVRWLKNYSRPTLEMALRQLHQAGAIFRYGPLVEEGNGLVAQAEHTILCLEKPIVTTRFSE